MVSQIMRISFSILQQKSFKRFFQNFLPQDVFEFFADYVTDDCSFNCFSDDLVNSVADELIVNDGFWFVQNSLLMILQTLVRFIEMI